MRFLSTLIASALGALIAFGLLFVIFIGFIGVLIASTDTTPRVRSGSVLVMELSGDVPERVSGDPIAQAFGGEARHGLRDIVEAFEKAAADDRIDAVWVRLRGISAPWASLEEIRRSMETFRLSGKPLYASSEDFGMDERDYFLASAADSVFVGPEALFQFNGFHITATFFSRLLDNLGIEPQIIRAGEFKSAVEPFIRQDLSPENAEQLRLLLDSQNRFFLETVARSRRTTPQYLEDVMTQDAVFDAEKAAALGLVDGLLFEDQIVAVINRRLGRDENEGLRRVSLRDYARVPRREAGIREGNDGEVAIVYAVGDIMPGRGGSPSILGSGSALGSDTFAEAMGEARRSDRIRAVVLRINSPGGFAPSAEAMWREIELTAAVKPVVVSMGDYAASGGYWIAMAADTIVADAMTLTGSIGVFSIFFDASDFLENRIGITFDGVQTSPYADMLSGVRSLRPEERQLLSAATERMYQSFLEKVARGRGLNVAGVDSVGQGRVWTGEQALEIGLVDVIGGLDTAVRLAAERAGLAEGTYRTRSLPRPRTFIDQISESMRSQAASLYLRMTSSPAERALLQQARVVQQMANTHGTIQARIPFELNGW
jgi:protease IV